MEHDGEQMKLLLHENFLHEIFVNENNVVTAMHASQTTVGMDH